MCVLLVSAETGATWYLLRTPPLYRELLMSRFGSDPLAFFQQAYTDVAPWDVGAAQPALMALFDTFPPVAPALDVGSGSGDHVVALAARGVDAVGLEFVERAVQLAHTRLEGLPPVVAQRAEFVVGDALTPSALGRQFATIVDSGFYHLFDADTCARLADELAACLIPGGRLYLLEFAVEFPAPNMPRAITEPELRTVFSAERGWTIRALHAAEFQSRLRSVPAIAACVERTL
jgi:SAM-dependent methyltransferase